jgi:serine/threonine-protein kinase
MSMGVLGRYGKLRARGITWSRIWDDDASGATDLSITPKPKRIARAAGALKRHLSWFAGGAITATASLALGTSLHLNGLIVPFVAGLAVAGLSAVLAAADVYRLRRLGVSASDALGEGWKEIASRSDDRPLSLKLDEELQRIAGPSVLNSAHGPTVRGAVDDRLAIKDASSRLSDADKMLVPDVEPTADALLERIGALASGLERLERDIPNDAVPQLDARIATVQAEPETAPDHERRLNLLTRQRASLQELVERRDTMHRQLESASMSLRSLRLDMVKLRTLGVGAAIGDVTNATQEARALSKDIGRALEAAAEVRKL